MSAWKEILMKDIRELQTINYTKLNVIQQDIANKFQSEKLTKMEVFCILNGLLEKEMVNLEQAKKYYNSNYKKIMDAEGIDLPFTETYTKNNIEVKIGYAILDKSGGASL